MSSALFHDLFIYGDDAYEILMDVRKKYATSFEGLHFPDYFPNESGFLLPGLARLLGLGRTHYKRLTVEHLAEVPGTALGSRPIAKSRHPP